MTTITNIYTLPASPYNDTGKASILITNGIPTFFKISGSELDRIVSFHWYPKNPSSVVFDTRQIILVDPTMGTFMVQVLDNYLSDQDRGGHLSFRLDNGETLTWPVITYGYISLTPLWTSPQQGLITG